MKGHLLVKKLGVVARVLVTTVEFELRKLDFRVPFLGLEFNREGGLLRVRVLLVIELSVDLIYLCLELIIEFLLASGRGPVSISLR